MRKVLLGYISSGYMVRIARGNKGPDPVPIPFMVLVDSKGVKTVETPLGTLTWGMFERCSTFYKLAE
jgi:hypothetical protein